MSGILKVIAAAALAALLVPAVSARESGAGKRAGKTGAAETASKGVGGAADSASSEDGIAAAAANRALGVELFCDGAPLWECAPAELAGRMKLKLSGGEGDGDGRMHSVFTKRKVSFGGCGTEEFRFFSRGGKVTRIDVMILNKGDSVKGKTVSSKRSDFSKRLQREERTLVRNLTAAFGSPGREFFGSGNFARRQLCWFCREAVIAIEMVDREFLMLHILPPAQLTRTRVRRSENRLDRARLDLTKNIRREENGDCFIGNVPMVDQGSKGYCVPATLERYFRYYGIIDFDMHRIADAGHTASGGGTVLSSALAGLVPMLHDCRLRSVSCGKLRLRSIAHCIDAGTPLIWALYSSPDYLKRLKEHNAARGQIETIAQWKATLRKMRRIPASKQGAHVCLIVGCNLDTEEIAVSNSWGPGGELAWVRFADAAAADAGEELYILKPR